MAPFPDPAARPAGHADVIIIGAGLSGVGTAVHLQQRCPDKQVLLLEAREAMGGTWDLFRYPGIRSDSDMHTLGYAFKPWTRAQAIADGGSIRAYIEETARERGIDSRVRYGHRVRRAAWSKAEARWTLEVSHGDELLLFTCQVVDFCSGYYRYDAAHRPSWPGEASYRGRIVHPQFWPEGLDYAGQRVVVIGSGATAVTLVPEMARHAAHVTMLQRSPTYVVALPAQDALALRLRRWLPAMWAYRIVRAKNVLLSLLFFKLARRWPEPVRRRLLAEAGRHLGGPEEVARNFTPHYNPWDQRLCMVPDGDLFTAIRGGRASVVTGEIAAFTETGLRLSTGEELQADLVVTATGLQLNVLGDVELRVDGRSVDVHRRFVYKGMMLSGVPNLVQTFGYTNASWTLKSDLTGRYLCRLLRYMDRQGTAIATPTAGPDIEPRPFVDFSSGYVLRAADRLPRQGAQPPWRLHQNYLRDLLALRFGRLDDGVMAFTRAEPGAVAAAAARVGD
ncbi:flavin-containing monooxygenase [Rhizobacter sp. LjRoot28]|uniref:flavin-containing monooxygenase n=1 Tax=Rhizobacter sp. LjRoot28 TaxID=3342309 RepID=UPI003ED0E4CA